MAYQLLCESADRTIRHRAATIVMRANDPKLASRAAGDLRRWASEPENVGGG